MEHQNFYSSPNIDRVIKPLRLTRHVAYKGETRNANTISVWKLRGTNHWKYKCIDGRIK